MTEEKSKVNIDELQKEIEEFEKKAAEYLAGWQRERADFLNYKKEEMERIKEFMVYAGMELVLKILPILDNFEIAEKKIPDNLKNDENIKGLLLIRNQLLDFLKSQGVEEVKSVGEKFDPRFHEVMEEVEVKDNGSTSSPQGESEIIIEEIQKGYKINGELLRPARVKIVK